VTTVPRGEPTNVGQSLSDHYVNDDVDAVQPIRWGALLTIPYEVADLADSVSICLLFSCLFWPVLQPLLSWIAILEIVTKKDFW